MNCLMISLVRVNDRLIGKTVSDRFNLRSLGVESLEWKPNQASVKWLRRAINQLFGPNLFIVRVERRGALVLTATSRVA